MPSFGEYFILGGFYMKISDNKNSHHLIWTKTAIGFLYVTLLHSKSSLLTHAQSSLKMHAKQKDKQTSKNPPFFTQLPW